MHGINTIKGTDSMGDKVMNATSYVGAGVSVVAGLTLTEWGVIVGIVTAFLTFIASQVWQARRDRREERLQDAVDRRAQRIHDLEVERLCRGRDGLNNLPSCGVAE